MNRSNSIVVRGEVVDLVAINAAAVKDVRLFSGPISQKPISVFLYATDNYGFEAYQGDITGCALYNVLPKFKVTGTIVEELNEIHLKLQLRF